MIGTVIHGNWRVVRLIGAGGMGAVYEVHHASLGIRRAMKTVLAASNPELLQRFHQEALATAALKHKNIIGIHDYGALPDGTQYIMMDLLEGSTLGAVIQQLPGPMPLARALRILTQIALALAAAHERGIVHRDLKPENVFLTTRDGEEDHVVLLDFGIAKLASGGMTRTHAVIGTPCFMPPEQLRGLKDVDQRVDVFALGAIAYLMVTGRMPFQQSGESISEYIELGLFELYDRQTRADPVDPRTYNAALPEDWAIGITSALHRDRARRPRLDELIVLFKRSTPNGQNIVAQCAKDLLKQAALEETLRVVPPRASDHETVRSKPSGRTPQNMPTPFAPPIMAAPPPHVPVGPRSGPETVAMPAPRGEPAPMLAIPPPGSTTMGGAASEAMAVARPRRGWLFPVVGLAVAGGAFAVGMAVMHSRNMPEVASVSEGSARAAPDAQRVAVVSDAAVPLLDAATIAVAPARDAATALPDAAAVTTARIDAATPVASAQSARTSTPPAPQPHNDSSMHAGSAAKPIAAVPHETGELRVIVEQTFAEVYVDGRHVCSSPCTTYPTVGTHTVTLRNDDAKRRETLKVTISASTPTTIDKPW